MVKWPDDPCAGRLPMTQQPLAYLNAEFLESAESRPIRILSEYLEPLRRFKEQKIQDTVVFFGSARVDAVTTAQAKAMAEKYLVPGKLVVIAVGDRAKIEPELRKLNLGTIEIRTADGKPAQ